MIGKNNLAATYGRVANAENNPLQQLVLLYDGTIKFLRLTASDIESNDLSAKADHSSRALDIIHYLQSILDFERGGDVAATLDALYTQVMLIVLDASSKLDSEGMRRAADLLVPVRDAWESNAREISTGSTPRPQGYVGSAQYSATKHHFSA